MMAGWGIYVSVNYAIIASDNALLPVWRQDIIWTNGGLLLIGLWEPVSVKF